MPSITDNSDSLGYIGWYGSAYLLSFGTMSTEAHIIYALVVNQWPAQGLTYVLAASIIVFGAGLISSCVSNSIASIVVGRALCGLGASAMLTGLFLIHESLRKLQRYKSAALLLMVHAIISLIAPM